MERPKCPYEPAPDGYGWTAVPAGPEWRSEEGRRCRRAFGTGTAACGAPSVADLNRSARRPGGNRPWRPRGDWWAYCAEHAYGKWVEGGRVMQWVLREVSDVR